MVKTKRTKRTSPPAEQLDVRAFGRVSCEVGECFQQGDLYLLRTDKLPRGAKPRASLQLADGDTQGSRHVLTKGKAYAVEPGAARSAHVRLRDVRDYQIGPIVEVPAGAVLEHPEHGDREICEAGFYQVVFQRSLMADGAEERARD